MIELLSIIFYNITACLLVSVIILMALLAIEVMSRKSTIIFETITLIAMMAVITVLVLWLLSGLALGVYGAFTH